MKPYKDIDNDSGVSAYEYEEGWIHIKFSDGKNYEYKAEKIGSHHICAMQKLADSGEGLNAYINEHRTVLKGYSRKW
jgi:hypothetical protein